MKKRIKQIIGVIIGIIIGISTTVGATTIFNSKDITYSSDKTSKTNVKDSLDELYNKTGKCPEGQYCYTEPLGLSDKVELGDYIKMTPTSTSYTPPGELTGCMNDANCTQNTLNPSELNLWRVIKKNEDGTIEIVSQYSSSKIVVIRGKTGYMNFVGALNTIAAQYTNEKYVARTRHVGYSNQIERCSEFSATGCPSELSMDDFDNIKKILGHISTSTPSGNGGRFWYPSRNWFMINQSYGSGYWVKDVCDSRYALDKFCSYLLVGTDNDNYSGEDRNGFSSVRPVSVLKLDVKIKNGDGKSESTAYVLD